MAKSSDMPEHARPGGCAGGACVQSGLSRRGFLAGVAAATLAVSGTKYAHAQAAPPVCVFSKHLQFLDYDGLAATCRDLGLDGVDLTVRSGGHVLPENVKRDLTRAVEAIRGVGLQVPMITTRLNGAEGENARDILETAAGLGIQYFRIGELKYSSEGDPWKELEAFTERLRGLIAIASDVGMTAGYHNHSGANQFGAPLWDLYHAIRTIGSEHFGSNFDVGHATVEGGYGAWQINARLMALVVKMMAVKDFVWDKDKPRWVPLGKGIVKTVDMFKIMRAAGFAGPISLHFEYKIDGHDMMIEEIRTSVPKLRQALCDAGYA